MDLCCLDKGTTIMVNTAEQRGREEEKRNMARKMLVAGMDIDMIVSITELARTEIEVLAY